MPFKLTLYDINTQTTRRKSQLNHYVKLVNDTEKVKRIEESLCVICYYNGSVGCTVITSSECQKCKKLMVFPTSATDRFCLECAKAEGFCRNCGCDINLKQRKKIFKEDQCQ